MSCHARRELALACEEQGLIRSCGCWLNLKQAWQATDLTTPVLGTWLSHFSHYRTLALGLTTRGTQPAAVHGVMVTAEVGIFPLASKRLFMWGLEVAPAEINPDPSLSALADKHR